MAALSGGVQTGKPKKHSADELQLCAQAMCLEEMLCAVPEGALYYGEPAAGRWSPLRLNCAGRFKDNPGREMHELYKRRHTPKVKPSKACNACS